jgi:dipeptidyl aminopeptidase/acylaminoacyl peptidase
MKVPGMSISPFAIKRFAADRPNADYSIKLLIFQLFFPGTKYRLHPFLYSMGKVFVRIGIPSLNRTRRRMLMWRRFIVLAVIMLVASGLVAKEKSHLDKLPPLIDREIFFGDPEISGGRISPDGKMISFRRPYKDVMNIWVKAFDEPFDEARPITADTTRPVRGYFWTWDSKYVLYVQDKGGDENFHVYAVDPYEKLDPGQDVPEARDLTPIDGIRATFYSFPKKTPDILYIGLNDRDERYHDVYRLSISTGERTLVRQNDDEMAGFRFDLEGNLRLSTRMTDDGGTEIFRVDGEEYVSVYTVTNEENVNIVRFHKDGKRVYLETNKGEDIDLSRLVLFDPVTLEVEFVESDPENQVDFGGTEFSSKTDEIIATYYVGDRLRIYFKDKEYEKDYTKLKKKLKKEIGDGDVYFGSSTLDDVIWLVYVTSDTDPGATYVFNREKGTVDFLYRPRPELPTEHLAKMKPVRYKARDGMEIPAYLTIPKGVKAKNLPVIIVPHGGPWARDMWGYDPVSQFLANRGYAVLQPNFRSSTGYGKAFFNAGKRKWGEEMQHDISDGVAYLIDKGIADPEQVGIFGGSYGGYATLAGLAFTPELYAVGVDFVGPSNLITLLNSIPPYWESGRKFFNEHVGDPNNPEDVERLKRQSPLFSAENITAPLLVVQGANDPRVKTAESEQIVVALRELDRDVEYMLAPDEGHGFAGLENRMAFFAKMEEFLAKYLEGRYQESMPDDIQARLDDLMIDVATVTLPGAEVDLAKVETAPLPVVDASLVRPITLKYSSSVAISGQEIKLTSIRSISSAEVEGVPVWRMISEQTSPMGTAADTFDIDAKTLMPVHRSFSQGPISARVTYTADAAKGIIKMGTNEMPVDVSFPAPVFGDDAALETALIALPLKPGYKTTYRTFNTQMRKVRLMSLEVTGTESVTVPAGTFDVFKIEIKPLDDETGGGGTVFVSEDDPRCLVRGTFQLPATAGGGTLTAELTSVE